MENCDRKAAKRYRIQRNGAKERREGNVREIRDSRCEMMIQRNDACVCVCKCVIQSVTAMEKLVQRNVNISNGIGVPLRKKLKANNRF